MNKINNICFLFRLFWILEALAGHFFWLVTTVRIHQYIPGNSFIVHVLYRNLCIFHVQLFLLWTLNESVLLSVAALRPQLPIYDHMIQKLFPHTKMIVGTWLSTHIIFTKKIISVKNSPKSFYGWENLPFITIFGHFWGQFNAI